MSLESHITTDGQSVSLSWNKAPAWGLRTDFYYCEIVAGLLMWGALSDKRTGLSFTIVPGPRQRRHFRVRLLWDSLPYFTVSDSRLPFPSPPATRRVTVEVFDNFTFIYGVTSLTTRDVKFLEISCQNGIIILSMF
jgi:hypothetical protein